MHTKYIVIVLGEPFSIFSEIVGKYFIKKNKTKSIIILIGNKKLFEEQLKKLNYKLKLNQIIELKKQKNSINIFDISFNYNKVFSKYQNQNNILKIVSAKH